MASILTLEDLIYEKGLLEMAEDLRSELAIKRDEWFESDEGKRCCADGLSGREDAKKYLKNRLEAAFLAGAKANEAVKKELEDKVLGGLDLTDCCCGETDLSWTVCPIHGEG